MEFIRWISAYLKGTWMGSLFKPKKLIEDKDLLKANAITKVASKVASTVSLEKVLISHIEHKDTELFVRELLSRVKSKGLTFNEYELLSEVNLSVLEIRHSQIVDSYREKPII